MLELLKNNSKPDKNEKFLKIIPGMAFLYKNNKNLIEINKNNNEFKIENGGHSVPNCCSLLVLTLQLIFIVLAIYIQKGSPQCFFLGDFSTNYLF